jgi:molecular chaperone GrpE
MNAKPDRPAEDEQADDVAAETTDTSAGGESSDVTEAAGGDGNDALAELQARVDENWDKFLRASAELENVRKRAARDVENAHKFALERFAGDLLTVCDSLEMALGTGDEATVDSLKEGSEATLKLLGSVLARFGIEEVNPEGEPFDPELHEAMTMQPSDDVEPGSVVTVFQKGFTLNGRLLRPARVVVAAEPAGTAKKG